MAGNYLAYDYPVLGAFWTVLWIFLWVVWIVLLVRVIADIFVDPDLSGWGKAGWLFFVLVVPFLGVFAYLIARGSDMARRDAERAQAQQRAMSATYPPDTETAAAELDRLSALKAKGDITEAEFQRAKEKILR